MVLLVIAALLYQFTNIFGNEKGFFAFGGRIGNIPGGGNIPRPIGPVVNPQFVVNPTIVTYSDCNSITDRIVDIATRVKNGENISNYIVEINNLKTRYVSMNCSNINPTGRENWGWNMCFAGCKNRGKSSSECYDLCDVFK